MQASPGSQDEAFSAIPVRNPALRLETTPQGNARISYPVQLKPWLAGMLPSQLPLPMRLLELDAMGSFVWQLIDGKNSVDEISMRVADHYAFHPSEARQSVAAFIRRLGQRGIVALR